MVKEACIRSKPTVRVRVEGGALPVDGLFESGTGIEVEDNWEKSDGAYGERVGGVWCFSDAGYWGEGQGAMVVSIVL